MILTHDRSDFDALASQVAAALLYENSAVLLAGKLAGPVREFFVLFQDALRVPVLTAPPNEVYRAVLVDTQSINSLGKWREWYLQQPWKEIHIYDHHPKDTDRPLATCEVIEERGATVSLLLDRLREKRVPLTADQATLFAIALHTDTGHFVFPQTRARDLEHAAYLYSLGVHSDAIRRFTAVQISTTEQRTIEAFLESARVYRFRDRRIVFAEASLNESETPNLSLVASKVFDLLQPDALFLVAQFSDSCLVIGRSSGLGVSLEPLWGALGGGGHSSAGSARIKNGRPERLRIRIFELLDRLLPEPLTAWDIMTFPVRGISASATIQDAHKEMVRYGHGGLIVYHDAFTIAGIITRKDVDRALRHRLSHQTVRQFMSHPVVTLPADASLEDIRRTLVHHNIGRVPIVSDSGEVIGIVTRNDLIRAELAHKPGKIEAEMPADPLSRIPKEVRSKLTAIGETAQSLGFRAFLVGGPVRDLLLNFPVKDYDIVIEGDANLVAKHLSLDAECTIQRHETFGTATVVFPEGLRIDLAQAREEYYPAPGDLPVVEPSNLTADLRRRDFTVNGIAVSLNPGTWDRIVDPYDGVGDLLARRLRVFHTFSFVEDPTRIFRAIRYKHRLGFTLEEHTARLLSSAISERVLRRVSGDRIRTELERTFEEPLAGQILTDLDESGVFHSIYRNWHLEPRLFQPENQVLRVLSEYPDAPRNPIYFLALVHRVRPTTAFKLFQRLRLSRSELKAVAYLKHRDAILAKLRTASAPSQIYEILTPLPEEFVFYLYVACPTERTQVDQYLRILRHVRLKVTGEDLIQRGATPGPRLGKALKQTLALRLDGRIRESEELETALRLYLSEIPSAPRSPRTRS
ncbi:MAG: CBS domain-containing protein [bacterium JZ-2024 1]